MSTIVRPAGPKRQAAARALSTLGVVGVILAELALVFVVVPHGDKAAAVHPDRLLSAQMSHLSLTIANIDIAAGIFALASMVGIWYLANQTSAKRNALLWVAAIALLAMCQLNVASDIEVVVQKAQPTGSMAMDAFNDIRLPAFGIVAVSIAFLVWYAWARTQKAQTT